MFKNKLNFSVFLILPFLISFVAHFLYSIIPFPLFAIYFPINESIFEHTKLTFTPIILTYLFFYIKFRKNFNMKKFLSSMIISISLTLVTMLSLYYITQLVFKKEIVLVSILCLLTAIIVGQLIAIYTYNSNIEWSIDLSIYILITVTFTLLILTIHPPALNFFTDPSLK